MTQEELQAFQALQQQNEEAIQAEAVGAQTAPAGPTVPPPDRTPLDANFRDVSLDAPAAGSADEAKYKALLDQTTEAMAANGETYTPVDTAELPPDQGRVLNFAAGFNNRLAQALGVGPDAANEVLQMVGLGLWKPGQATQEVKDFMQSIGIRTEAVDDIYNKIGASTFDGAAQLAVISAAAPRLAAQAGVSVSKFIGQEIEKILTKSPGLAIAADIGSSAGGTVGSEATKNTEGTPTGAVRQALGTVAGAVAGGAATTKLVGGTVKPLVEGAVNLGQKAMSALRGTKAPAVSSPEAVLGRNFDVSDTPLQSFAESQLVAGKAKLDDAITQAVDSVPQTGTAAEVQIRTRAALEKAERIGNRVVSEFWSRVPVNEKVPMAPIHREVQALQAELADTPFDAPTEAMDRLMKLGRPQRGPDGRMTSGAPTIKRLRHERAAIRRDRLAEEGKAFSGQPVNDAKVRNFNRLEGIIDDAIQAQFPNDVSIQQARNMSVKYHDAFSRGALSDVLARRSRGDAGVAPDQTVETLMKQHGGLQDLKDAQKMLVYKRAPGGRQFAITPAERADLQNLTAEAENSIRAMFREKAADLSPEDAAKWFQRNERMVRPLATVHAELTQASRKVFDALEHKKLLERSALERFVKSDPDKAISRVWNDQNPRKVSKELMTTFQQDPEAMAAYQKGLIRELIQRGNLDVLKTKDLLNTPRFRDMLSDALEPQQFNRLVKTVDAAYSLMQGKHTNLLQKASPVIALAARVFGAQLGRNLAHFTGGGTVQTPSYVAEMMRRTTERALKWSTPQEMFANAMVDPKWESLLKDFGTIAEGKRQVRSLRRTIAGMEAARVQTLNAMDRDDD